VNEKYLADYLRFYMEKNKIIAKPILPYSVTSMLDEGEELIELDVITEE